jgi:tetratricopeptide (TPR) repeat protein
MGLGGVDVTERQSNSQPENQANQQASRGPNPYVGPRPFERGETLYGREREVLELYDLLIAERIVLLHSPSGAGKTSLLQAALLPKLRDKRSPSGLGKTSPLQAAPLPKLRDKRFRVLPIVRVNSAPLPASASANRYVMSTLLSLERDAEKAEQRSLEELATLSLQDYFVQRGIIPRLRNPSSADPSHDDNDEMDQSTERQPDVQHTILIFDQFEEILTIDATNRAAKTAFFAQLGAVLAQRHIWAIFALRDDYVAQLDPYLRPLPTRLQTRFRLDLLDVASAQAAIQKPADDAGVVFTDAAAQRLVADLAIVREQTYSSAAVVEKAGGYIEPVQLQVVCQDLWEKPWAAPDVIDVEEIKTVGDVDSALATYYVNKLRAAATQTGIAERAIRTWFTERLITGQNIRNQVLHGSDQGLATQAIDALVNAYLVRREERRGATWFELAHDRLVTPVQEANNAWFAANLSTLQRQAAMWHKQGQPKSLLLHGDELAAAEAWQAANRPNLTDFETKFLQECQDERTRIEQEARQNQYVRWLAIGATMVVILAAVAIWGLMERRNAKMAEARANTQANLAFTRQLLVQAAQAYSANPLLGLRLSLEADAHLTQPDPLLRSQIITQTRNYVTQGKIATIGVQAAALLDVLGTPWLVIKNNASDTPGELRRKADGALVTNLAGSVASVNVISDVFPSFIVAYMDGTPDELRHKTDGTLVRGATGSVAQVYTVSDAFPYFLVEYEGDTPSELRRKADGALVGTLTGLVREVNTISDTSPYFLVEYGNGRPSELRRKADGALVSTLTGAVARVDTPSDAFPYFVVEYRDDTPSELRHKADGALVSTLAGSVARVDTLGDTSPYFVVRYEGDAPGELRRKADGALVPGLVGSVREVNTISDTSPYFVVDYEGDTLSELRRKADGALVPGWAGAVREVNTISDISPYFVVDYEGYTPSELRNKADGALVPGLAGAVREVNTISDTFPYFVVRYAGDTPSELRRKADGALVSTLAGAVREVDTLSDTSLYFVVDYAGDMASELRRKADGALVGTLAGSVARVDTLGDTFPYFVVDYADDTPGELRRKADGVLVSTLTGLVREVNTLSDTSPYFVVDYAGDTPGELRRKADGALVSTLASVVEWVDALSDAFPYFVVKYAGDRPSELRHKADGALVRTLAGSVAGVYLISDAFPYFMVEYADGTPGELRDKADGALVPWLAGAVMQVDPISDTFPYFVVRYNDDTPWELRNKADGALITDWVATIDDQYSPLGYFFVKRSDNQHTELWQLDPPKRLTDLGIGLPWQSDGLSTDVFLLNAEEQTLAIRYEDGRAYLLDLAWLAEIQERTTVEDTGNPVLTSLACLPFAIHPFEEALLQNTEYLGETPSLACPEPLRLVEQGRHAAQQLDVATASAFFQAAIDQDPKLAIKPEVTAAQLAAQSLVRQGRLLLWQSKLDEAAAKLIEALGYDPTLAIDVEIEQFVLNQLAAGQTLLTAQQIVTATLRFDTLTMLEETVGAGTLDQTTKVTITQAYVTIGEMLAQAGNAAEATAAFAKAQALDPALTLDPVAEVTRLAPTPTATATASPLVTPMPVAAPPLVTPTATVSVSASATPTPVAASPLLTPTATVVAK